VASLARLPIFPTRFLTSACSGLPGYRSFGPRHSFLGDKIIRLDYEVPLPHLNFGRSRDLPFFYPPFPFVFFSLFAILFLEQPAAKCFFVSFCWGAFPPPALFLSLHSSLRSMPLDGSFPQVSPPPQQLPIVQFCSALRSWCKSFSFSRCSFPSLSTSKRPRSASFVSPSYSRPPTVRPFFFALFPWVRLSRIIYYPKYYPPTLRQAG